MQIKYLKNPSIYSVVEIYFDNILPTFRILDPEDLGTPFLVPSEDTEIIFPAFPPSWVLKTTQKESLISPKSWSEYKGDFWDDYLEDREEALKIYDEEILKILAFDSRKSMKQHFAAELQSAVQELETPEALCEWAQKYDRKKLKTMYSAPIDLEIVQLLDDLTLSEWNLELAVPPEKLANIVKEWESSGGEKQSHILESLEK